MIDRTALLAMSDDDLAELIQHALDDLDDRVYRGEKFGDYDPKDIEKIKALEGTYRALWN